MSDLLSIGASGVAAYQTALSTTSDNIANAGTAGYARRTTSLSEVSGATGGLTTGRSMSGYGVRAAGINRSADAYQAQAVRSSGADLARTQAASTWLDKLQSALTGNDLGSRITSFFTGAQALAADPTSTAARATMLEAGTSVSGAFAATGRALDGVAADLDDTADNATGQLGTLGAALAKVNDGLGRATPGSSGAAGLADQRDQLLEQMGAISDVAVQTDAIGRATVRLGGGSGPVFVSGNDSGQVTYARGTGGVSFAVHFDGGTSALTPTGGALAGLADAAGRVTDARAQLNELANGFATGINKAQAQGQDLAGQAGQPIFATGATPTDLSLSLTDPAGIAAASVGGGLRDNSNLAQFATLRTAGGFEAKTTSLVAGVGAALSAKSTVAAAQASIHDGAVAAREAGSGVNMDQEAVDLIRFQQAYQASSRVIQVARDTFQSILSIQ
jgi:flagellar hook-associated protein 1 FlgK